MGIVQTTWDADEGGQFRDCKGFGGFREREEDAEEDLYW
jgi:hypothetical protein